MIYILGTVVNSTISNAVASPLAPSGTDSFSFDIPNFGAEDSLQTAPYHFSTPLNCKLGFAVSNGRAHPKEHSEPVPTNIRRRTRNVHFMMAGGKITSSEESPINLVDLDRSMDTNPSS